MKKIVINETEYSIDCNAYTRILYNSYFKSKIFKDFSYLQEFDKGIIEIKKKKLSKVKEDAEIEKYVLENIDDKMDVLLRLTYITIKTANKNFMEFEEWLCNIPNIDLNGDWITTVIDLITDCFRG